MSSSMTCTMGASLFVESPLRIDVTIVVSLRPGAGERYTENWCEYTGRGIDQSCGVGWQAAVHPDDLPGLLAGWQSAKASEPSIGSQVRLRGKDGQYKSYLFRGRASVDASGEVVQWCGFATD